MKTNEIALLFTPGTQAGKIVKIRAAVNYNIYPERHMSASYFILGNFIPKCNEIN